MELNLVYFAWCKEKIGLGSEQITAPNTVQSISDLMSWLIERGDGYAAAFSDTSVIRSAVNQEHSSQDSRLKSGDEVAFFPPVTGG
ncbi:molybdopterin converting factor subunit 1 [Magnetovibrio sp. PR-2]|uniref:molybdopterin converting factor subunit 1 n=1 Tax=Magnetovibrio sp. PR-2 TaxID=3120356 RepID=UPI002FCDFC6A